MHWNNLNLIDGRYNFAVGNDPINLLGVEIGHANGFGKAEPLRLLHTLPGLQVINIGWWTVGLKTK